MEPEDNNSSLETMTTGKYFMFVCSNHPCETIKITIFFDECWSSPLLDAMFTVRMCDGSASSPKSNRKVV